MKFKKVKIQAFRAYDKVEDGTFDFTRKNNDCADFVAIYAPNGFGKTSFYDAVEWGVTQNIHRLAQRKSSLEYARSEKNQNAEKKHYVLRNKHSKPTLQSYVRLETTNPKITGHILEEPRKGQSDFKFVKSKSNFQEVVLSQEWIDAFLKEDEPQARYQTFVDYFGDKDLDEYFKNIVALQNVNEENIKAISTDLRGLQLDLKYDGDTEILTTVNNVINELRQKGERLNNINLELTASDSIQIGQTIFQRISELELLALKARQQIENVNIAFAGNESLISLDEYGQLTMTLGQLNREIGEQRQLLERFKGLEGFQNEILTLEKRLAEKGEQLDNLNRVKEVYDSYQATAGEIARLDKLQRELKASLKKANTNKDKFTTEDSRIKAQRTFLLDQLKTVTDRIGAIPQLRQDWEANNSKNVDVTKKIDNLKKTIETANENLAAESRKREHQQDLLRAVGDEKSKLAAFEGSKYTSISNLLAAVLDEISEIDKQIYLIDQSISQQEALNADIQNLIEKGLGIASKQTDTSCPLCLTVFASHQALIEKITSNPLLEIQLQNLLRQKNSLEEQKIEKTSHKQTQIDELRQNLLTDDETFRQTELHALGVRNELVSQLSTLQQTQLQLTKREKELNKQCSFGEIDKVDGQLKEQVVKMNVDLADLSKSELQNSDQLSLVSGEIMVKSSSQNDNIGKLKALRQNQEFLFITNFFAEKYPGLAIDVTRINSNISDIELDIKNARERHQTISGAIEQINLELAAENKDTIENALIQSQGIIDEIKRKMTAYEQNIKTMFSVSGEVSNVDLNTFLNNYRENAKIGLDKSDAAIAQFRLLQSLIVNVEPFLKYEKALLAVETNKERLNYLKTVVKPALENERKNVSDHLDQMINSFFYEDIINDIYKKIDPHPEYKKIKFKCDFSEDKPLLNVFVTEEDEDVMRIPNLYFSTAQLNILSLSIFLAKALNARDEDDIPFDCIFIDDPIQSMDSINILSTIDLLRGIVFNKKKQIILSTHDDNFFSLLQKKMPPDRFKSKFIELETFGKVKTIELNA